MHAALILLLLAPSIVMAQQQPNSSCLGGLGGITDQIKSLTNGLSGIQQLTPCDATDCNSQGTCLGWKQLKLCICNQGFLGASCEQTACTSASSCNGNGLCLGSTTSFLCLCNLGYIGNTCNQTFTIGK